MPIRKVRPTAGNRIVEAFVNADRTIQFRSTRCVGVILACSLVCSAASAQRNGPAAKPLAPANAVTAESLEAEIKALQEKQGLDEAVRKKAIDLLQKTSKELSRATAFDTELQALEKDVKSAPREIIDIQPQLDTPLVDVVEPSLRAPLENLQQSLTEAQTRVTTAEQTLTDLETKISYRAQRRTIVPIRLAEARKELEDVTKLLQASVPEGEPPEVTAATKKFLAARERMLTQEIRLLQREIPAYDATARLLNAKRDLAAKDLAQARREAAQWQEIVNKRRQVEAREHARDAKKLIQKVNPAVRPLAKDVAELAEQLVEMRSKFSQQIVETTTKMESVERRTVRLKTQFEGLEERAATAGFTNAVGVLLRQHRQDLPDPRAIRDELQKRQSEISEVHLQRITFQNQQIPVAELETYLEETTDRLASAAPQDREQIEQDVRAVVQDRRRYLAAAIQDSDTLIDRLANLDSKQRSLLVQSEQQSDFIAEHILWVRSAPRFSSYDARQSLLGVRWMVAGFSVVGKTILRDAEDNIGIYLLGLLAFCVLLLLQPRVRKQLRATGNQAAKRTTTVMRPTWVACGLTLVMSAFWPLTLLFFGWRLLVSPTSSGFSRAVGSALLVTAVLLFTFDLFRHICRPGGLGRAHFDWPERATSIVRGALRWLLVALIPLVFLAVTTAQAAVESHLNSIGRLCLVGALLSLAIFAHRVLRPSGSVLKDAIGRDTAGWLARTRYLWHPLAVGIPVVLAIAALAGYHYTARQLSWQLLQTYWVVLGVLIIDALLKRWLVTAYRALAMKQARERRLAMQQAAETAADVPADDVPIEIEESAVSLAVSNAQIRRLIKIALAVGSIATIWFIWTDVLPAFGILRNVELWPTTVPLADGTGVEGVDELRWITLEELALAIVIGIVTLVASRNVPGLLEFTLLQRLPLDAGARYASTTICRYAITVAGAVAIFRVLGFSWEGVQWLVAAMTVGLGFGLQEIFANFVSGLIILFERPIRVGDTVTVGSITGSVTRIRIRATTISDWDRKELIIPNREFVTGQLINWSLSDPVIRVVVRVGIAYGSNVRLAKKLLLQIAADHPQVLQDPAPNVMFWEFGESSLNFELRIFVNSISQFRAIPDDMNTLIDDAFREHGIEIAFPQRDLHIRSVDSAIPVESRAGAIEGESS